MTRFAAFLRGLNLGARRLKNEVLRSSVEAISFENVAIFRASGNVILDANPSSEPEEVAALLEVGLADALGYEVAVFLRTAAQVRAIAGHRPFDAKLLEASEGKLQVALLPAAPGSVARGRALALVTSEDRLAIRGRELY